MCSSACRPTVFCRLYGVSFPARVLSLFRPVLITKRCCFQYEYLVYSKKNKATFVSTWLHPKFTLILGYHTFCWWPTKSRDDLQRVVKRRLMSAGDACIAMKNELRSEKLCGKTREVYMRIWEKFRNKPKLGVVVTHCRERNLWETPNRQTLEAAD